MSVPVATMDGMTTPKYPLTELSDAVAPARERHRRLIDSAAAWSASHGRHTDPDHFALVCAGAENAWRPPDQTLTRWTRTGTHHVVRCDIPNWCSMNSTLWPASICEDLWDWFDFLHATGRLDSRSDPVAELRKPLACYGWLDQDGRRLPQGAERQIPCECFLPYRETAELLGEIVLRCERSGEEPLDVLRRAAGHAPVPRWSPAGDDGADLFGELDPGGWSDGW